MLETGARRKRERFDPARYERQLIAIINAIAEEPDIDSRKIDRFLKRDPKDGCGLFSRSELIAGFRAFRSSCWPQLDEAQFLDRLRLRPIRTLSGVTPVTVLTKPYPCPGKCVFCPNDVRMPKSYLSDEPGAQRAEDNRFDPYLQTWNRLDAYHSIGHPVAKVELIILGGTWSFHPEAYQVWFVKRCFDALNDYGGGVNGCGQAGLAAARYVALPKRLDGRNLSSSYNQLVSAHLADEYGPGCLDPSESASWDEFEKSQLANESAKCRNVGLVVETRPDHISEAEVRRIRRLGGTKVQIGIQSLSDRVLEKNRRGCDVAATRRAIRLLRGAGFKIHAHWMVNLLGSTPQADAEDFERLFEDPDFRPDELKLYPCSLIESAELMGNYERGEWRPYDQVELVELLADCLLATPSYCRITRVIRDFSAGDIIAGNKTSNLREVVEDAVRERGQVCRDIRSREIRKLEFDCNTLWLRDLVYETSIGEEHFVEFSSADDLLVGFLRLTLPREPLSESELRDSALIREIHVYGDSLEIGRRVNAVAQHQGLGRRLVERAAELSRNAGFTDLAVISAVGTRAYYRGLGFRDGELYQHRSL